MEGGGEFWMEVRVLVTLILAFRGIVEGSCTGQDNGDKVHIRSN